MRLVSFLDVRGGTVVCGMWGRRNEYQPISSLLTPSCTPVDVARTFRDRFGLTELYLADLDAIAGSRPAQAIYKEIRALGCRLWVDAGVRDLATAEPLQDAAIDRI